ncbi:MAG: hypothetical protein ACYDH5_04690 [Acidimicrobiales bacterium]
MSALTTTAEQEAAIDELASGRTVVIEAGTGTRKWGRMLVYVSVAPAMTRLDNAGLAWLHSHPAEGTKARAWAVRDGCMSLGTTGEASVAVADGPAI